MNRLIPILFLLLLPYCLAAQLHCSEADRERVMTRLDMLPALETEHMSIGSFVVAIGKSFSGTPYEAKTLEIEGQEQLVVYLDGLDCTTFLENVIVLSRLKAFGIYDFESFTRELTNLRYRDGAMEEYPSRLHYFSDWLDNNSQKGIIENVSQQIGGSPYDKTIDFMSSHREAYQQLADDRFFKAIQIQEKDLNSRKHFYLPKEQVAELEEGIQDGDLIAITSGIKGLDIAHVGFAVRQNGRIHLLHASTGSNEVELSAKPLADYLTGNKRQTGIMVGRLIQP